LALAGGGPLGITYEIGALLALEEALDGVRFHELPVYVGVSAGAVVASALANGFTPAQLCQVLVLNQSAAFPVNPEHFLRPAWRPYVRGLGTLPGRLLKAAWASFRKPRDTPLPGALLNEMLGALPPGVWDNERIHRFLAKLYGSRGRTNDFRRLKRRLFVVTMNLDTGEITRFGAPGQDHVPISRAVQASTAVPGLFPPVAIGGRYYVDGGVKKTVHASTALDAGAELLICINPIVSFNHRLADPRRRKHLLSLVDGGLPTILAQASRIVIHSRMKAGMARYAGQYPDRDILLFEPNPRDADMFFARIFSFSQRVRVCEHAYQTTRADLRDRRADLQPLLARYGVTLRADVLADRQRRFDSHLHVPPDLDRLARLRHPVTNELSHALDQLELWLEQRRDQARPSAAEVG
jgi:predicted acylesterase/phospholipase RssA